ncbi:MAG: hypothetical protein EXQ88_00395 [Alphaproteobacteria bacterium]|nr:hypothetical protein [Alphaproteobacteria bacterium]
MRRPSCVIVGGGQAGARATEALRKHGYPGAITLVSDETYLPYERPPLSKSVLTGADEPVKARLFNEEFYRTQDIALRLATRAESIDRAARRLRLAAGESLAYDTLLLATGARPRRLALPGSDAASLYYLRGIDDCLALRHRLQPEARVVLIGGGYIGLEVAAAARARGAQVTVLEAQASILARVAAPEVASAIAALHRRHGVEIRTGVAIEGCEPAGAETSIRLKGGATLAADVIVVGIGILPNVELAASAGLVIDGGILVDSFGRSSDPAIYAAGDVASFDHPLLGRRVRLESWQNAQNQAIAAARAIAGAPLPYSEIPWFWSDQYDVNLQLAGLPARWDRVVLRGDRVAMRFTAFYLDAGRLVAVNAANSARDIAPARQMIARGIAPDPALLADPSVDLRSLVRPAS